MNRTKEIRQRLGISPAALAGRLGISVGELTEIEAGRVAPNPHLCATLVELFNAAECGRYDQEVWTVERVFGGVRIYG